MDVRAQDLLNRVREIPGAENSVIVGSAVRDGFFNLQSKKVTIILPYASNGQTVPMMGLRASKRKISFGNSAMAWTFPYEGLDACFLFSYHENAPEFGDKVIAEFDYGVNFIYYDGKYTVKHEFFDHDFDHGVLTLRNLNGVGFLPGAIARYNDLCIDLGNRPFRCPLLSMHKEEPKKKSKDIKDAWLNFADDFRMPDLARAQPAAPPVDWRHLANGPVDAAPIPHFGNVDIRLDQVEDAQGEEADLPDEF